MAHEELMKKADLVIKEKGNLPASWGLDDLKTVVKAYKLKKDKLPSRKKELLMLYQKWMDAARSQITSPSFEDYYTQTTADSDVEDAIEMNQDNIQLTKV